MRQNLFIHLFPPFLESQHLSFLWFLKDGVKKTLSRFPIFFDIGFDKYTTNSGKYFLTLPTKTAAVHKVENLTYCLKFYLLALKELNQEELLNLEEIDKSKNELYLSFTERYKLFYKAKALKKKKKYNKKSKTKEISKKNQPRKLRNYTNLYLGEIPMMSPEGSFIINGTERCILNQMIRGPGVLFQRSKDTKGILYFSAAIISEEGLWFKIEISDRSKAKPRYKKVNSFFDCKVVLNTGQRLPLSYLLLVFGLSPSSLIEMSRYPEKILDLINYTSLNKNECLLSIYPDFFYPFDEEEKEEKEDNYQDFEQEFEIDYTDYTTDEQNNNIFQELDQENISFLTDELSFLYKIFYNSNYFYIGKNGRQRINQLFKSNFKLSNDYLTSLDLVNTIDGLLDLMSYKHPIDEVDHLANKKVRAPGHILRDLFSAGLDRLFRHISETLAKPSGHYLYFYEIIDPRCLSLTFKEFFTTSEISQFLDNLNPLADLTHKRRVTVLGLEGINVENASFDIRDIHSSQYGRLCPIETPEGQNTGLVTTLSMYSRLNVFGFLETPYFVCKNGKAYINHKPRYSDSKFESILPICASDITLTNQLSLGVNDLPVRFNNAFYLLNSNLVEFLSLSPFQLFSLGASLIPFFEHNDANRVLMGANMQRQALPLLLAQKPIVGTGTEFSVATQSGMILKSYSQGTVTDTTSNFLTITDKYNQKITYLFKKYLRTNGDTCINQKPLVWIGEKVFSGQVIVDGPAIIESELALGSNLLLAYMPWEGYNFEDAVVISENVVMKDLLTSIHIEEYQTEVYETDHGPEQLTNKPKSILAYGTGRTNLGNNGLILEGSYVSSGDLLVGKATPTKDDKSPEGRFIKTVFGFEPNSNYNDTSLLMPRGCEGRVIDVRLLPKTGEEDRGVLVTALIRIYIAQIRKILVGDKVSGRHGNKGVISTILPIQDMPYLPDGRPIDIIFNPLGVPSRMNVGQLFECLLGFAGEKLEKRFKIVPFDETFGKEASRILVINKLKQAIKETQLEYFYDSVSSTKVLLQDGRTGEFFDNPVFIGRSYVLKLMHLVEDKIHARTTGPYALITQQPLGGRAQEGGQRFGEMEVWALEAYGASYTLQELLTIKSDDIEGRNYTYQALRFNKKPPQPKVPEAFNVLTQELRALGLDLLLYKLEFDPYKCDSPFTNVDMFLLLEQQLKLSYDDP